MPACGMHCDANVDIDVVVEDGNARRRILKCLSDSCEVYCR